VGSLTGYFGIVIHQLAIARHPFIVLDVSYRSQPLRSLPSNRDLGLVHFFGMGDQEKAPSCQRASADGVTVLFDAG